jgi:hypothetical protein
MIVLKGGISERKVKLISANEGVVVSRQIPSAV